MTGNVSIEINESVLKQLVLTYIADKLGDVAFTESDVKIETKSKQNYRSVWESAAFRVTINRPL